MNPTSSERQDPTDTSQRVRRPGRPLSPAVDRAIFDAVLAVLADKGFRGLTISGVAARARVGKATIYRRWPSKEQLVIALVRAKAEELPCPDTGEVREDLVMYLRRVIELMSVAPGPQVVKSLMSEVLRNRALADAYMETVNARRAATRTILERGVARRQLRSDLDYELALDTLTGPAQYRVLATGTAIPPDYAERLVDALLGGLAPRSG